MVGCSSVAGGRAARGCQVSSGRGVQSRHVGHQPWSGVRLPIVVLVVSSRQTLPTGDDAVEAAIIARLDVLARARAVVESKGGRCLPAPDPHLVAAWGTTYPGRDDLTSACAAARQIAATIGEGIAIAIDAGMAVMLDEGREQIWSTAIDRALQLAPTLTGGRAHMPSAVPADVEAAWQAAARVARLPPPALDVLRSIAVIGERLDVRELAHLTATSRSVIAALVETLVDDGLVRRDAAGRRQQVLTADAALADVLAASVLSRDRRKLHARLCALLEARLSAGTSPAAAGRIALLSRHARHAELAGRPDAALASLRSAAALALGSDRAGDAVPCLESALALAGRNGDALPMAVQVDVIREAATAIGALRGNASPEVRDLCQRGIALLEHLEGREKATLAPARFELMWGLQTHELVRGEIAKAAATGRHILGIAASIGRDDLRMVASRLAGLTAFMGGELASARRHFQETIDIARTSGEEAGDAAGGIAFASDQVSVALTGQAWVEAVASNMQLSAGLARAAVRSAEARRHPHTEAHVVNVLAARALMIGDRPQALALSRRAHQHACEHGFVYWETWSAMIVAAADPTLAAPVAVASIHAALERYRATGARQAVPFGTVLLVDALLSADRLDDAIAAVRDAMPLVAKDHVRLWRAPLLTAKARIAMRIERRPRGRPPAGWNAAALATEAYAEARLIGATLLAGHAASAMIDIASGGDAADLRAVPHRLLA